MISFIGLSVIAMTSGVFAQTVSQAEWDIMNQLNALRAEGITCPGGQVFDPNPVPLKWDCGLWKASALHSQDMADNDYFDHYSQDGRTPWQRASAQGVRANAENIAAGSSNPHGQWAGSDGHCRNMMNKNMVSIAIGRGYNGASSYRQYWTQMLSYDEPLAEHTDCYRTDPAPTPYPTLPPSNPTTAPEPTSAPEPTPNPTGAPTLDSEHFELHPFELKLLEFINDMRFNGVSCNNGEHKAPVHELEWNCGLWKASQYHVKDEATNNFYSHISTGDLLSSDLAQKYGVDHNGCHVFDWSRASTPEEAWASIKQYMCNYYLMEDRYLSFGAGYAYNPNSDRKHYWRIMLGKQLPSEANRQCTPTKAPNATPRPSREPTLPPTPMPTSPTMEPTPFPTHDDNFKPLEQEMKIFELLNNARTNGVSCNNGVVKPAVHKLEWNCALWKSSHYHAQDMATNNFYSITGSDGKGARDRAEQFGDEGVNCSSFLSYHGTAEEAWAYYFQYMCNYFLLEDEFLSFGAGYAYNPNSDKKHYWTFTLGRALPRQDNQQCLEPATSITSSPTAPVTPIPTAEPTLSPTTAPTSTPTLAPSNNPTYNPTNAPTNSPTNSPTEAVIGETTSAPTPSPTEGTPVVTECGDLASKKDCKKNNDCTWKSSCQKKSKICPKQKKEKKCNKYNCIWSTEGADHCTW